MLALRRSGKRQLSGLQRLDRKEAEANAMAAQAQDARAEADRLESVSAEERERTAEARTDVEECTAQGRPS